MPQEPVSRGQVISAPNFDTQGGWSAGYTKAKDGGIGVVVGPGRDNPNVFAQPFQTTPGAQYRIDVTAFSLHEIPAMASAQVNWLRSDGTFIQSSQQFFLADFDGEKAQFGFVAPDQASTGILYVIPGASERVRYTKMSAFKLDPVADFLDYRIYDVKGSEIIAGIAMLILIFLGRRQIWAAFAFLYSIVTRRIRAGFAFLSPIVTRNISRILAVAAAVCCVALILIMEPLYEEAYDSQLHQGWVDVVMQWKTPSLEFGGNPMRSFGIQPLTNPYLSPTFLIGLLAPPENRIPVQAAFQALIMLFVTASMARYAGARRAESYAIAVVAQAYCWDPLLSAYAIPLNALLGLFWQETAATVLIAFYFFTRIGNGPPGRWPWAAIFFAVTIFWFLLSLPYTIAYFVLALFAVCLGSCVAIGSIREFQHKLVASVAIAGIFFAAGVHTYIVRIFLYTPQLFYSTLYVHDFHAIFLYNTSLLLTAYELGGDSIFLFFAFVVIGGVAALRYGNRNAVRIVMAAAGFEIILVVTSAVNSIVKIVPLTFTYVELTAVPILALLAGTGVWAILRMIGIGADYAVSAVMRRVRRLKMPAFVAADNG